MIGFGPGTALHRDSRFHMDPKRSVRTAHGGSVTRVGARGRARCARYTADPLSFRWFRMSDQPSRRGAWLALAVMVMVWAYSWVIMKQVLDYAGPFDFAALRYGGGAVVLLIVLAVRRESLRPTPLKLTVAVGLCQTTAFQALSQWALVGGGAGHVSMLAYTMPFWVVLLAWWLLKDKPTPRHWLGLALAAAGLVCVMEPWHGLGRLHSSLLAVAGGFAWARGTV